MGSMHRLAVRLATIIVAALLLMVAPALAETTIYKCADPGGITYRDTPCANASARVRSDVNVGAPLRQARWQVWHAPLPQTPARRSENLLPPSARLAVGMTDTQVLNLSAWGRPAQIARSKLGLLWREQWTYKDSLTGADRRILTFENAMLIAEAEAASEPSFQPQARAE